MTKQQVDCVHSEDTDQPGMRGFRKFCQRGSNFNNVFCEGERI